MTTPREGIFHFKGKVVGKTGEVVFERVTGYFEIRRVRSMFEWDGQLTTDN